MNIHIDILLFILYYTYNPNFLREKKTLRILCFNYKFTQTSPILLKKKYALVPKLKRNFYRFHPLENTKVEHPRAAKYSTERCSTRGVTRRRARGVKTPPMEEE